MDRYCVMGNPVDHSKSPWIHSRFAQLTGQQLEYGRRRVEPGGFEAALRALRAEGGKGCNVTLPFKFEAFALADETSDRARRAGACNTLRFDGERIFGDNTDGFGLVSDIERNADVPLAGRQLLLVGAGGAAAGVLGRVIEARPARVVLANRTLDKATALVESHRALADQCGVALQACRLDAVPGSFDVVVNATASSISGAAVPVAAVALAPGALAYDMMYGPAAQGFLDWARAHGAQARDGLGMLVEQAAESFFLWRDVRPPAAQVLGELRATLG